MTTSGSDPMPFEVWRVPFEYEDDPGVVKARPVVILGVSDGCAMAAKVTGHGPRREFPGEVRLADWDKAGLSRPSTVRCSKRALIQADSFGCMERYGTLTERDEIAVREALNEVRGKSDGNPSY